MVSLLSNETSSKKTNLGTGVGLRIDHHDDFLASSPTHIQYLEIISENFMTGGGRRSYMIDQLRERYPIVLHGVAMSIGSTDPLNLAYMQRLKQLADRCRACLVSDHVCWTGVNHRTTHDLLPVPYNDECLAWMIKKIKQAQDILERPLTLENPSSYVEFTSSTMKEWDFLAAITKETSCQLLLDINNVYVSSINHSFDALAYLKALDPNCVVQYHLAGHTDLGTHILDTHIGPLPNNVLDLYAEALRVIGPRSTLIEWDEQIPTLDTLDAECARVSRIVNRVCNRSAKLTASEVSPHA